MRNLSFIAAAAIVMLANAVALMHAARNRSGTPDAEVTLTQRELRYVQRPVDDDDSGVTLHLQWTDPSSLPWPAAVEQSGGWLDRSALEKLGFDCSVDPASPDAERHYQRQRPRQVFVALEYGGEAWRAWLETYERAVEGQRVKGQFNVLSENGSAGSHLVAIDADRDPARLRARHPDRTTVVIMPVVIAVTLDPFPYPGVKRVPNRPVRVVGRIQELPSSIHVPRPFSGEFTRASRQRGGGAKELSYRVWLRYGVLYEPWVTGVQFGE